MSEYNVLQIRESISMAREREALTHSLQLFLESKRDEIHRTINLPAENGQGCPA